MAHDLVVKKGELIAEVQGRAVPLTVAQLKKLFKPLRYDVEHQRRTG